MKNFIYSFVSVFLCMHLIAVPSPVSDTLSYRVKNQVDLLTHFDSAAPLYVVLDGDSGNLIDANPLQDTDLYYSRTNKTCLYGYYTYCVDKTTRKRWPSISFWTVGSHVSQITWLKDGVSHTSQKFNPGTRIEIRNAPVTVTEVRLW